MPTYSSNDFYVGDYPTSNQLGAVNSEKFCNFSTQGLRVPLPLIGYRNYILLRGTFSAAFSVMWEVPQSGSEDEIEAGIFCLLLCAFLLATSPIWIAILFFSRNYKDPN